MKSSQISFLLEGEPWTRRNTLTGLLGRRENDPEVRAARDELLEHPLIAGLLDRLNIWRESFLELFIL